MQPQRGRPQGLRAFHRGRGTGAEQSSQLEMFKIDRSAQFLGNDSRPGGADRQMDFPPSEPALRQTP